MSNPIWTPDARRIAESSLSQFGAHARRLYGAPDGDYRALANPEALEYFRNLPELAR